MNLKAGVIVGVFAVLTACGTKDNANTAVADVGAANEQFDVAVADMTSAYFYHVPKAATQLGVS
jgi:hypothetical protein